MSPRELSYTDRAHVRDLLEAAAASDGVAPLSEEHLLALRRPGATAWLTRDPAGAVTGIASRSGDAVEVAVHPAHRRRGHGRVLVAAALDEGAPGAAAPGASVGVWAHGDLPEAQGLAASLGLVRTRELLRLHKQFGASDAELPRLTGAVALADLPRGALPGALTAWLDLNGIAFADHPEQGRWSAADVADRVAEPWFDPARLYLLPWNGLKGSDRHPSGAGAQASLAASAWVKPDPDEPAHAEIYVLAVHPDAAGRGLGRALLDHALGELARAGTEVVDLYVDGGNERAVALYERAGFAVVERHAQYAAA